MNFLGGLLGSSDLHESVSVLLHRLQESRIPEERKKTITQLKDIAFEGKHQEIGESLDAFVNVLKLEKDDPEITKETLEILISIMTIGNEPRELPTNSVEYANCNRFLKEQNNITALLDLLRQNDYSIQYHATQLLRILLTNKKSQLQQSILNAPMGIANLMDLLRGSREIVRNETLLLLLELTKANQDIQKIVAFEGAFEILLQIIYEEGLGDGGIVVQDCLRLVNNLLRGNVSNQNFFRETSEIGKITPLLQLSKTDMWILTDDKSEILILALELVSLLVSGNNPSSHVNQNVLVKHQILDLLIPLSLGKMNSLTIRTKALISLGNLVHGNKECCTTFASIKVQNESGATVSAVHRLIFVALKSSHVPERNAALRVFKCYLSENQEEQVALASSLTPTPSDEDDEDSISSLLLKSLLSWENEETIPYRSWYAACIIAYILKDNLESKELLLKIPLEIPKPGVPMVTLLTKCMRSLTLASRINSPASFLAKIALLRILVTWMDNCSSVVKVFLQSPSNLPFLVELSVSPSHENQDTNKHVQGLSALGIGLCFQFNENDQSSQFDRNALRSIILQRIGMDQFLEKLDSLRKTHQFILAEQGRTEMDNEPEAKEINYYDYDFTTLFKSAYDKIQREIRSPTKFVQESKKEGTRNEEDGQIDEKYHQNLLKSYKDLIKQQEQHIESLKKQLEETKHESPETTKNSYDQEVEGLRKKVEILEKERDDAKKQFYEVSSMTAQSSEHDALSQAYEELQQTCRRRDEEIFHLKEKLNNLSEFQASAENLAPQNQQTLELKKQVDDLRKQIEETKRIHEQEMKKMQDKYDSLEKEQEDLIEMLTNYEMENTQLKAKLQIEDNAIQPQFLICYKIIRKFKIDPKS